MKPEMPVLCFIKIKKQNKYKKGDIVAFENKGHPFIINYCHRITEINDETFTTKGDNRPSSDKYETDVPIENILGKITDFKKVI